VGLFESGFNPISLSLLNEIFPRARRATAMGIYSLGAPMGMFVALALGGIVAQAWGWRTVFQLAAVPGLVMAVLFVWALPEPRRRGSSTEALSLKRLPGIFAHLWNNRVLLHTGVGMAWSTVVLANLAIWTPSFLARIYGLGQHQAGLYSAFVVGVSGAIGAVGAGWLADRLGVRGEWRRLDVVIFGIAACVVCGFLAFIVAESLSLVLILLGLTAFFGQFYIGICNSVLATHSPEDDRAGTISVFAIGYNLLAYGLGPTLVGKISDMVAPIAGSHSIGWGLSATLLFSLVGAVHFVLVRTALRAHAQGAGTQPRPVGAAEAQPAG
jgi:MFS family permease